MSLVSFAAITLCVASQQVFIVVVYFVIDSVRKLLDTPSSMKLHSPCFVLLEFVDYVGLVSFLGEKK
jgi:hypothetical protein